MSAEFKLIIYAGQTLNAEFLSWTYKIKDGDGVAQPVDLTGYAARAQIRTGFIASSTVLLDMTTANSKLVLGGSLGTIAPNVSSSDTASLWSDSLKPAGFVKGRQAYELGFWDMELIAPSTSVKRLMQGHAVIVPEATRS